VLTRPYISGSAPVGRYSLAVSAHTGSFAQFASTSTRTDKTQARTNAAALRAALAQGSEQGQPHTPLEALEKAEDTADAVADRIEHANKLFRAVSEDHLFDRNLLTGEIGALLGLLDRLDREGRYEEEIRVAKALHGLCVLAFRWLDLIRSLRSALAAARAVGDKLGEAWALNELGALHLCAGDAKNAAEHLEHALELQEKLGDAAGRCATRHNCDSARRDIARPIQLGAPRRLITAGGKVRPLFTAGILAVAVLLGFGGVSIAQMIGNGGQGGVGELVATIGEGPTNPSARASATFSFSAEGADEFKCKLDNRAFKSCASPARYRRLKEGTHVFRVKALSQRDTGPATAYAWRVDLTAPTTTITDRPSVRTRETSAAFLFEADEEVKTFECKRDNRPFVACTSPKNLSGPLDGGMHVFAVRAIDLAGNVGEAESFGWTVAATPGPETKILRRPESLTNETSATFVFQAPDAPGFRCHLDNDPLAPCASGQSFPNLADGTYTFEVHALNTLGTAGPPATWTWTVDTVPPIATIDERNSTNTTFVFTADEAGSLLECRLLDAESEFGLCASPRSYADLAPGYYNFEVKAIDEAGNEGRVDQLAVFVPLDVE
jgi:tetratricopeptide (TPR) repeat protein